MYYPSVALVALECALNAGSYAGRFYPEGITCTLNHKNIHSKVVNFHLIVFFIKTDPN